MAADDSSTRVDIPLPTGASTGAPTPHTLFFVRRQPGAGAARPPIWAASALPATAAASVDPLDAAAAAVRRRGRSSQPAGDRPAADRGRRERGRLPDADRSLTAHELVSYFLE